jgi:hypothetical protein
MLVVSLSPNRLGNATSLQQYIDPRPGHVDSFFAQSIRMNVCPRGRNKGISRKFAPPALRRPVRQSSFLAGWVVGRETNRTEFLHGTSAHKPGVSHS